MVERFADETRRVFARSEREARALNHAQVGTEHLLLALLHEDDCVAARALRLLSVTRRKARARILKLVDIGSRPPHDPIEFTPRVKEIIEDAVFGDFWLRQIAPGALPTGKPRRSVYPSASGRKDGKIETDYLLFAVLAHREGVAAHVLGDLGVDLGQAVVAVRHVRYPTLSAPGPIFGGSGVDPWSEWPPPASGGS